MKKNTTTTSKEGKKETKKVSKKQTKKVEAQEPQQEVKPKEHHKIDHYVPEMGDNVAVTTAGDLIEINFEKKTFKKLILKKGKKVFHKLEV